MASKTVPAEGGDVARGKKYAALDCCDAICVEYAANGLNA
jgi:hypothetical protein